MKANILICARKECFSNVLNFSRLKEYFENKGHEVIINDNFCNEINNTEFTSPFTISGRPVVFAGCSPLVMETRIKNMFDVPLEIANIREQCAWVHSDPAVAEETGRDIISLAVKMSGCAKPFQPPPNVLKQKLSQYLSTIEEMGPNPFKM